MPETAPHNPFLDANPPRIGQDYFDIRDQLDADPELAMPMSSPEALGTGVVQYARIDAYEAIHDPEADLTTSNLGFYIDSTRKHLAHYDAKQQVKFGKKLLAEDIPEWLLGQVGGTDVTPGQLIANLTTFKEDEKQNLVPVVSDETFTNLMQWHNHVQGKRQEVFEREKIAPLRKRFVEHMQQAIEAGWMPADALSEERLKRIAETPVYIDDGFYTDSKFGPMFPDAAYANATELKKGIVLGEPMLKKSQDKLELLFTHEMVHIITGTTPEARNSWQNPSGRRGTYGMHRLYKSDKLFSNEGLDMNEAITEHTAQALLTGDVEHIRPLKGSYKRQRYVLKALCTRGLKPISPVLFVRALMAGPPHDGGLPPEEMTVEPAVTQLESAWEAAFPGQTVPELYVSLMERAHQVGRLAIHRVVKELDVAKAA